MPAAKGPLHLKVVQANLRHSRGASAIVQNILGSGEADILLIQEPWVNNGVKGLTHKSAYFPGEQESREDPPPTEVKNLINYCRAQKLEFIISCDANAHNTSWGSTDINKRE